MYTEQEKACISGKASSINPSTGKASVKASYCNAKGLKKDVSVTFTKTKRLTIERGDKICSIITRAITKPTSYIDCSQIPS